MSKSKELREMSQEQLESELTQTQRELFDLRIKAATEKLDAPSNLRKLRRSIARMKTLLRERETGDVAGN
jgi:large subunit ribosomal protein L29